MATETLKPPSGLRSKLSMEHVIKVFERDGKSVPVLDDINLDVSDGEFIASSGLQDAASRPC